MALTHLYTAQQDTVFIFTDSWTNVGSYLVYSRRDDCALYFTFYGTYKIFRDGSAARRVRGDNYAWFSYDVDNDRVIATKTNITGYPNYYVDTMHNLYNPSQNSPITYDMVTASHNGVVYYKNEVYRASSSGNVTTVSVFNRSTGSLIRTYTVTATLTPFSVDTYWITRDGKLILVDRDNGTKCLIQFYDLPTSTLLYETSIPTSRWVVVDDVHNNIWSVNASTLKLEIYSFQPAPSTISTVVTSNRSRYKQDTVTVTLTGSDGEKITNWPIGLRAYNAGSGSAFLGGSALGMTPLGSSITGNFDPQGDLADDYGVTDENGVFVTTYCGPGSEDFSGQSVTIEAWTAY